jgi:hypothetical protein
MSDPRSFRVNKIIESGVMELQVEKFTQLNILPSTKYEIYHNSLRSTNPSFKQIGTPTNIETREMEVNTEDIEMCDKEMQFTYGDDTGLYNLLKEIKKRKKESKNNTNTKTTTTTTTTTNETLLEAANIYSTKKNNSLLDFNNSSSSTTRLTTFLQKNSFLIETILEENLDFVSKSREQLDSNSKKNALDDDFDEKKNKKNNIFDTNSTWLKIGDEKNNGQNELIRSRKVTMVKFSFLQPQLFMTVHPFPVDVEVEDDLKPFKVLFLNLAIFEVIYIIFNFFFFFFFSCFQINKEECKLCSYINNKYKISKFKLNFFVIINKKNNK